MASSKVTADIIYRKPGTQPPVYVAGTFSDPPWQAHEMEYTPDGDGEYTFKKEITAEPGSKIQYKFRIGPGDWWVLHDDMPTVTDDAGNTNHELEVPHPHGLSNPFAAKTSQKKDRDPNSDPVSPKTVRPGDSLALPIENAPKGIAERLLDPHSGTSTPTYAQVAAEVADSAALLNEEKPETPIPDDLAGRIGYRRLTSTPIVEVANTAAEVADTARDLDSPEAVIGFRILPDHDRPPKAEDYQDYADEDDELVERTAPLFSHEAIGMYDDDEDAQEHGVVGDHHRDSVAPEEQEFGPEDIDLNDPTLERFPSDREDIIDTVRKLETGLSEDRADPFEDIPPSPIVGNSHRGLDDAVGDFLLSPIPVSPAVSRPSHRLDVPPKSPRASISSAHSSTVSLQAIAEAEEPSPTEESNAVPAIVLTSMLRKHPHNGQLKLPDSDEDEGVALSKHISPETPKAPKDTVTDSSAQGHSEGGSSQSVPQTAESSVPKEVHNESPRIVVEASFENRDHGEADSETSLLHEARGARSTDDASGEASTTALDGGNGSATHLRKRGGVSEEQADGPVADQTPGSSPEHKEGSWLKAIFRLLFVDWIGGFISRLCGGRRRT